MAVILDWVRSRAAPRQGEGRGERGGRYAQEFTITFFHLEHLFKRPSQRASREVRVINKGSIIAFANSSTCITHTRTCCNST